MQKKLKGLGGLYKSILQKRTKLELIDDLCSLMSTYGLHMIEETKKRAAAGGHGKSLLYKDKKKMFAYAFNKLRMEGEMTLKSLRQYLEKNHPDPNPNPNPNPKLDTYWERGGTNKWYTKLRKGEPL